MYYPLVIDRETAILSGDEARAYTRTFCDSIAVVGEVRRKERQIETVEMLYFDSLGTLRPAIDRLHKMGLFDVERNDDNVSVYTWREIAVRMTRVHHSRDWWWEVFAHTGPAEFAGPVLDCVYPLRSTARLMGEHTIFVLAGIPYIEPEDRSGCDASKLLSARSHPGGDVR